MLLLICAGYVTAGGSIFMRLLTNTGSPSGWKPDYYVELVLRSVFSSMITSRYPLRILYLTGLVMEPRWIYSPLRINLGGQREIHVMRVQTLASVLCRKLCQVFVHGPGPVIGCRAEFGTFRH